MDKFHEAINFAIEREKEAAAFYHNLQDKVKNRETIEMLRELEAMENGHIRILENLSEHAAINFQPKEILDLKIGDYLVSDYPNPGSTFQEVLIIAIKREKAAQELYLQMAKLFADSKNKNIFLKLAEEEAKHKLQLESFYDDVVYVEN
ncbi:MAG: hypothetical protein HW421_600 [Ignavibacteria bacterium]|nr:hypothetical protein [Ignavibacteria bacterium]